MGVIAVLHRGGVVPSDGYKGGKCFGAGCSMEALDELAQHEVDGA